MVIGGNSDHGHVQTDVDEFLHAPGEGEIADHAMGVAVGIRRAHEDQSLCCPKYPGVVPSHHAEADQSDPEIGH